MDKLAIHGGRPVRDRLLPYGGQWLDEQDIEAVASVLRGDYITQGPMIAEFERKVAERAGAEYAVAFCNGTAALHGACYAAGIRSGDEVITTPLTFAASANCILYQGGTPVFADVDPYTYLLDSVQTEAKITPRTKAVIPVDFTGRPVEMRTFRALADKHDLILIQDAAHSFGASCDGETVGSVADMTMFSFHPVKPVTTGEGGVIVTDHRHYYEKMLLFRSHGITRDPASMHGESEGPWYYEMVDLGYNYRMTDIQAALGVSQLRHLDGFIAARNRIAKAYHQGFSELAERGAVILPKVPDRIVSGWHLYLLQFRPAALNIGRKGIFEALRAEGIGVNVHYIPVHLQPYYRKLGYAPGLCPQAEELYQNIITLPIFPRMTERDVSDVISAVNKVMAYFHK